MATAAHIPVNEYLQTTYRPDCDYVDGEVVERNVGEQLHGSVQKTIASIFYLNCGEWALRSLVAQRVEVRSERFRVPDVCAVPKGEPVVPILETPPLICIEVLTTHDLMTSTVTLAQE